MPLLGFIASAAISHRTGIAAEQSDYFAMSVAITGVTVRDARARTHAHSIALPWVGVVVGARLQATRAELHAASR
eukprot:6187890-Pleurochrysis_carterae.AAC.1